MILNLDPSLWMTGTVNCTIMEMEEEEEEEQVWLHRRPSIPAPHFRKPSITAPHIRSHFKEEDMDLAITLWLMVVNFTITEEEEWLRHRSSITAPHIRSYFKEEDMDLARIIGSRRNSSSISPLRPRLVPYRLSPLGYRMLSLLRNPQRCQLSSHRKNLTLSRSTWMVGR